MKQFSGFKSEDRKSGFGQLPAGPYVAVIKAVRLEGEEPDQRLILRMDIAEGENTGYFLKRYKHDSEKGGKYDARYKGDFRIRIPNDENKNALYPESDKANFNKCIYRIEESNPGYRWDWNEQGLVGKLVGINMQEDEYNGFRFTKIGQLEIADDVRKGIVQPMKPKVPRGDAWEPPVVDEQSGFIQVNTDEVPF